MGRLFFRVFFLGILILMVYSCDRKQPEHVAEDPAPSSVQSSSYQPLDPQLVELSTHALPYWRTLREKKPVLVLMSFDPFLQPIPGQLRSRAKELVLTGSNDDIDLHGSYPRPDPVIMPTQTLTAALQAELFSRVYWIFPSKVDPSELNVGTFRKQMVDADFMTEQEAERFFLENGRYVGRLRGTPFEAVHPAQFPYFEGPMVLHIDLSFFRGLYENEIKTPLYDLIHQNATRVLDSGWQPLALTLSYSTLHGAISLDTRFVLSNLAQVLRDSSLLTGDMPEPWRLRAEALYAADMYTESKSLELYREAAHLAPEDPAVIYDLFQSHLLARETDKALTALGQAVARDPGYGAAYLSLAEMALNDGNLEMALRLLEKGAQVFPANPFLDIQRADLLLAAGRPGEALALLNPLLEKQWSPTYHPDIPDFLVEMRHAALNFDAAANEPDDEADN